MGVLLEKNPVDSSVVEKTRDTKSFTLYLEKYKSVVAILSLKVNEDDECMLDVEFDHSIDAPTEEVTAEVGRVIIEKLEAGVKLLDKAVVVKDEKTDGEPVPMPEV